MGRNKLGRLEMEEQDDLLTITIPSIQDSNRILVIIALLGLWFLLEMYFNPGIPLETGRTGGYRPIARYASARMENIRDEVFPGVSGRRS